jgi:hypothetical protein
MRRNADRKVAPMSALPQLAEPTPDSCAEEGASAGTHGWSPYEVWRTRVLMPGQKSALPSKQTSSATRFTKK